MLQLARGSRRGRRPLIPNDALEDTPGLGVMRLARSVVREATKMDTAADLLQAKAKEQVGRPGPPGGEGAYIRLRLCFCFAAPIIGIVVPSLRTAVCVAAMFE
jgi:hypothetical protein